MVIYFPDDPQDAEGNPPWFSQCPQKSFEKGPFSSVDIANGRSWMSSVDWCACKILLNPLVGPEIATKWKPHVILRSCDRF